MAWLAAPVQLRSATLATTSCPRLPPGAVNLTRCRQRREWGDGGREHGRETPCCPEAAALPLRAAQRGRTECTALRTPQLLSRSGTPARKRRHRNYPSLDVRLQQFGERHYMPRRKVFCVGVEQDGLVVDVSLKVSNDRSSQHNFIIFADVTLKHAASFNEIRRVPGRTADETGRDLRQVAGSSAAIDSV